jgi:acyl carrier protein
MKNREEIKKLAISELSKRAPKGLQINGDSKIIKDLRLISDDASEVIMVLEKATGAKPPIDAWREVYTVDEMIDLLLKYAPDASAK